MKENNLQNTKNDVVLKEVIQVISHSILLGKEIDVYGSIENPLFLAKDVAIWIEYDVNSINKLLQIVSDEEKLTGTVFRSGQNRQSWLLTEDGLYEILMQSRKPIAKEFKKGIKEILRSIRKTGSYSVQQSYQLPQNYLEALEALVVAEKEKLVLKSQNDKLADRIEQDATMVKFADALLEYDEDVSVFAMAKILCQNGHDIGGRRFYAWLRDNGYICKQRGMMYNLPTQKSIESGIMAISKGKYFDKVRGYDVRTASTVITAEGQKYFIRKFDRLHPAIK